MNMTVKELSEFILLYKKHFGEDIDEDLARKKLELLVRQMSAVYQPLTARELKQYVKENDNGRRIRQRQ